MNHEYSSTSVVGNAGRISGWSVRNPSSKPACRTSSEDISGFDGDGAVADGEPRPPVSMPARRAPQVPIAAFSNVYSGTGAGLLAEHSVIALAASARTLSRYCSAGERNRGLRPHRSRCPGDPERRQGIRPGRRSCGRIPCPRRKSTIAARSGMLAHAATEPKTPPIFRQPCDGKNEAKNLRRYGFPAASVQRDHADTPTFQSG